jgi:hypothetical protein
MLQWENQVNYLDRVTAEETERREKLTKLLEKEEALTKLRWVPLSKKIVIASFVLNQSINRNILEQRDWDIQASVINRIIEEISHTENCQRELAEELGFLYEIDSTDGTFIQFHTIRNSSTWLKVWIICTVYC